MAHTVALVGALHPAARGLALALEDDPATDRVLGLSGREPPLLGPKFEFVEATPGSDRFAAVLGDADTVVLFPLLDVADRNGSVQRVRVLEGIDRALEAATRAGAVVLWSSGVVYGAHPDNPVPLPETAPTRPNEDFAPAGVLADAERTLLRSAGDRRAAVLRSAAVWAPAWGTFLARLLQAPAIVGVRGFDPPVQALHPDDAVAALALAVTGALDGVYNVAPDDWVPASTAVQAAGRRRTELPSSAAFATAERLWRLGAPVAGPGELRYHMHPWVLDNAKLKGAGWTPARSTVEALAEAGRAPADRVRLGRVLLRRADVYRGAAAGLAVLGALAAARRRARRRLG